MKRPLLLALLSALLLALTIAPVGLSLLAWVAFVPLFFALDIFTHPSYRFRNRVGPAERGTVKRVFIVGFFFGFIFFLATVYWVVHSLYIYGGVSLGFSVGIMLFLVAYLALYPAVFSVIFILTRRARAIHRLFLIPSIWVALEYFRGLLFTGFPWASLGYSQASSQHVIQIADLFGVSGIGFLIVMVNFAIFSVLTEKRKIEGSGVRAVTVVTLVLLTSTFAYGFMKMSSIEAIIEGQETRSVSVVQGNIEQSIKWTEKYKKRTVDIYTALSAELASDSPDLVVWPESAVPFFLNYNEEFGSRVREVPGELNSFLLTGSPHFVLSETEPTSYYNSAFLIDSAGDFIGRYDKVKLVPFGEYIPLKRVLFFLKKLTAGHTDFIPGAGHYPLRVGDYSVGVLICFESIFPAFASSLVESGASFLVVITNDAWFGRTSAAYQHFDMAVLRAVENRVHVVRAANTGISAVIDPLGRVAGKTGLFETKAFTVPVGLRTGPRTFYSRFGWAFPVFAILFSIVSIFIIIRRGGINYV